MNIPEISSYYPPFATPSRPQVVNPVLQTPTVSTAFMPKREVEYVSGAEGAGAVLMGPNSSALYLDKELNVLWVVATDQNGNKSLIKGYNIGDEYVPPKSVTMDDLMAQMKQMNERLNKMEENSNAQSYSKSAGQSKPNGSSNATNSRNDAGNAVGKPNGSANVAG